MLLAAAREHGIDLSASYMIGDRDKDVAAGAAAGCVTFLIGGPYNEAATQKPDYVCRDLAEAAGIISKLAAG
jgi:D-glycero-D-manno-heptose 1,7-bisphosphate phosphatase